MALLEAVLVDGGRSRASSLAGGLNVPVATMHRHLATLRDAGLLTPVGGGRHVAGPRMLAFAGRISVPEVLSGIGRQLLPDFARRLGCVVQLGTLDGDMVTYRVKAGGDLFTKVGMQLEAYCSAIGKVLLAHLPDGEQARYLEAGPFVQLTAHTITEPRALAKEFAAVRRLGFACDREEISEGLACIAVPLRDANGMVVAAISASRSIGPGHSVDLEAALPLLEEARGVLEQRAFGRSFNGRFIILRYSRGVQALDVVPPATASSN